ncbi:oligopeptide/dipeptide ABC transporter ATP-binding protein [Mesorhizobium sp. INR15]|uniref:oligopeptide/dipeptide ABC transporter ATP-binding protein n=1 Tax=Mesorhizobium sp. INR15 TaxID=2654248 RepID=UPI0021561B49|nr:oligopeptide/dipeptide ABC transporter ATP-binding protein [Mesorhizobium sp. INR15]
MRAPTPSLTGNAAELVQIPGSMPSLSRIPVGCAFHPRCAEGFEPCSRIRPGLLPHRDRMVACHLYHRQGEDA